MENIADSDIRFQLFIQENLSEIPFLFTFSLNFCKTMNSLSIPLTLQNLCADVIISHIRCYTKLDSLSLTILPSTIVTFLKLRYPYTYFIKISKFIKYLYDRHCSGLYVIDPIIYSELPRQTLLVNKLYKYDYFRWRSWEYEEAVPHPTIPNRSITLNYIFCNDCFNTFLSRKNYLSIDDSEHSLFLLPRERTSFFELSHFYCQECFKPLYT